MTEKNKDFFRVTQCVRGKKTGQWNNFNNVANNKNPTFAPCLFTGVKYTGRLLHFF
jgi:hypothetical protein